MKVRAHDHASMVAHFGFVYAADRRGYEYFVVCPDGSLVTFGWSYGACRRVKGHDIDNSEVMFSSRRVIMR